MAQDISAPHMALLYKAMYRNEYEDDAYQRLQYLRLWESLVEAGPRRLSYQGDIREDNVVVAGRKTLKELKDYRDDIAHWSTEHTQPGRELLGRPSANDKRTYAQKVFLIAQPVERYSGCAWTWQLRHSPPSVRSGVGSKIGFESGGLEGVPSGCGLTTGARIFPA